LGSNPAWILSCEEVIQLAYGMLVVLLQCMFMTEIKHEGVSEVFLNLSKLESPK
jgi:hypothetical protein